MTKQDNHLTVPEEENEQSEDMLGDVRQSLIEADAEEEKAPQKKNFFQTIKSIQLSKLFKKKDETASESSSEDEDVAELSLSAPDDDQISEQLSLQEDDLPEMEQDEEIEIDDEFEEEDDEELIDEVDDEDATPEESDIDLEEEEEEEEEIEPEVVAAKSKPIIASDKDIDGIRDIALEDYTEEPVEEIHERREAWRDFFQTPLSQLRLIERLGLAALLLIAAGFLIWIGVDSSGGLQLSTAKPTNTPDPSVPIPVQVELPGGWSFRLNKGSLDIDGEWYPLGAEWLEGTEICRWVALPWSMQLEAVIRTLHADDEIMLTMSNFDVLPYRVQSIKEVGENNAEELNLETPSLLIILANQDSNQKWVLTAVPLAP